ncbi:MAG: response regulator [Clostridiales Family XIII bacterium]|jgi:putative two-component system response regulator|nr:response regulator [Clostridiales Family XIII bacterium]
MGGNENTAPQEERKIIMLVDDNQTNLKAGKEMLKDHYTVYPAPSAQIMFGILENVRPDLILLDIEMPEMNGYEAIRKLKSDPDWYSIPVIFVTALTDTGSELEGLSLGAIDYIPKPFSGPLLLKRIENHLFIEEQKDKLKEWNENLEKIVTDRTKEVVKLQNAILGTVGDMVEFRDDVTGGHVARTQKYLELLIDQMVEDNIYHDEVSKWNLDYLLPSAQLHDVGKIAITDLVLQKPGKLTEEEFEIMKSHASIGIDIIKKIEENVGSTTFLKHALNIAGGHHEKWDGTGYPAGLAGEDIPLEGRLMAIADVYDALVSKRPYKDAFSTEKAKQIIDEGSGTQFDPKVIAVFDKVADKFAEVVKNGGA